MRSGGGATFMLVLVLSLSACSSGPPPLTKAEYVSRANDVCKRYNDSVQQQLSSMDLSTRGGVTKAFDVVVAQGMAQETELKALVPPKDDRTAIDAIFAAYDKVVDAVRALREATAQGDQTEVMDPTALPPDLQALSDKVDAAGADSDRLIDAYGFTECGSGGASA
jgi:hypothetical protein